MFMDEMIPGIRFIKIKNRRKVNRHIDETELPRS
jgi:hypothetical protein